MTSRSRVALRVAVGLLCLALASCVSRDEHAAGGATTTSKTLASVAATGADSGVTLAPITSHGVLSIAGDGRARVTLVNVWATWCMPCREEFPDLVAAAEAHRGDGVRLVLVSTDEDEALGDVRRFLRQHAVRDTAYLKHEGDMAFIDGLNPGWSGSMPATFVYDHQGRRVAFWEGRADRARFEAAIKLALGAATTEPSKESHS